MSEALPVNPPTRMTTLVVPAVSLWRREIVSFLRKRSRIVGALGTPIVFWLLIGSGLRNSFAVPSADGTAGSQDYLAYAFPGAVVLVALFTSVFSMISVIEDRKSGFMQAVLVAPADRLAIVMGKIMGCSTLAIMQGVLLLLLSPLLGISIGLTGAMYTFLSLLLISVALSGLGFMAAWPLDSTQGFHAVMNLVLMPMWLLSGAFFPASGAAGWITWLMTVNPLTYGVALLRHAMHGTTTGGGMPTLTVSLIVTTLFAAATIAISCRIVTRTR